MHTSIHSEGTGNFRHSPRNGFTTYFALSPGTGLFAPVISQTSSAKLGISVGMPGPHNFVVRTESARLTPRRGHHIPPHVLDDRETPLVWRRDRLINRPQRLSKRRLAHLGLNAPRPPALADQRIDVA